MIGSMSERRGLVPLPAAALLERIGLACGAAEPAPPFGHTRGWRLLVDDDRPLASCLEWRLAELNWVREGVQPFIEGGVPFLVNNSGSLSEDAAALLFENCAEAPSEGPIRVLEMGAGTGLFARYLMDELQRLCERQSRDFYGRLEYWVTDRSPRTVEQWGELEIFAPHAAHVVARACRANDAGALVGGPLRAVFANYVLDVLPASILRRRDGRWEEMHARAWLTADEELRRLYTRLDLEEIRALARSDDPGELARLLPLVPLLESEVRFLPCEPGSMPELDEVGVEPGAPFTYNHAALACVDSLLRDLPAGGFVLVNDYAAVSESSTAGQRFGASIAAGLNFPLLERRVRGAGFEALSPSGDEGVGLHARLLLRGELPQTRETFERRFSAESRQWAEAPEKQARQEAGVGMFDRALASWEEALKSSPGNWLMAGEAAAFLVTRLKDYAGGVELARRAVARNPWYSPFLWNVLGDALTGVGRAWDAHECYLQAERIHPRDPGTSLSLARSWLALGEPERSLLAVARGLANASDANTKLRPLLLEQQQRVLDSLSLRWNAEREIAARRAAG